MKRITTTIVFTPLAVLVAAADIVPTVPSMPAINPIIEIWRTTGLQGLSLFVALASLWLVKYLVDKLLSLAEKEAQNHATLNAQLAALLLELRQRTRIVSSNQNDDTPFGNKNFEERP